MPRLSDRLKSVPASVLPAAPVWTGPNGKGKNGGVTQGLINRWLSCAERARLHLVEGLRPVDTFNHKLEYGNLWHVCEEALAQRDQTCVNRSADILWQADLLDYARNLAGRYPMAQEQVDPWYNVCRTQFSLYVEHWSRHPDVTDRTSLLAEHCFDVPYVLPSGRTVRLRGKWDSVDLVGGEIFLMENKSKGDIKEEQLKRQLASGFELQTQLYLVALTEGMRQHLAGADVGLPEEMLQHPDKVVGVRYNVIRRPLSGGAGSIVRHKATAGAKCPKCSSKAGSIVVPGCPKCGGSGRVGGKPEETKPAYYARLRDVIVAEPETFFMRWHVRITPADVVRFRRECLDPMLENLCDDWEWWHHCSENSRLRRAVGVDGTGVQYDYETRARYHPHHRRRHFRMPHGLWNPLAEGGETELDENLRNGSMVGLERTDTTFPELEERA